VEFGPTDPRTARWHRAALASVPQRLQEGRTAGGVRFVDGGRSTWATEVASAIKDGACGVLVSQPGRCPRQDIDVAVQIAASSEVPVAVNLRASGNRALLAIAQRLSSEFGELAILDAVQVVAPAEVCGAANLLGALVDQIALLERVATTAGEPKLLYRSDDTYVVRSCVGSCAVNLSATVAEAGDYGEHVDLVGISRRWSIRFPDLGSARPAEIVEFTRSGAAQHELIFESTERTTWIALHDAVRGISALPLNFATFAKYHHLASAVLTAS
jgi:hypothetical protein